MLCERPNALKLLEYLGRRIGFMRVCSLGHCDPVKENCLRLLPNSLRKARFWHAGRFPVTLNRSLVWPHSAVQTPAGQRFTPHAGFRLLEQRV